QQDGGELAVRLRGNGCLRPSVEIDRPDVEGPGCLPCPVEEGTPGIGRDPDIVVQTGRSDRPESPARSVEPDQPLHVPLRLERERAGWRQCKGRGERRQKVADSAGNRERFAGGSATAWIEALTQKRPLLRKDEKAGIG